MQDQQPIQDQPSSHPSRPSRRLSLGAIAGVAAVVLAAGSGTAWWTWNSIQSEVPAPLLDTTISPSAQPSPAQPAEQTVQVYWVKDTGTKLELVPAPFTGAEGGEPEQVLKGALEHLLTGTPAEDAASTIPPETTLRSVSIEADGVHVDLSDAFEQGGGSASMTGRLGQIVYTATTLDPSAKVWISVNGEPLEVLGGEGILVEQPMTRSAFDQDFAL